MNTLYNLCSCIPLVAMTLLRLSPSTSNLYVVVLVSSTWITALVTDGIPWKYNSFNINIFCLQNNQAQAQIVILYEPPQGKTNNVVSEQVRHKPFCPSTEKS